MKYFLFSFFLILLSSLLSSLSDLFLKQGSKNILNFSLLWKDSKFLLGILFSVLSFIPFVIALIFTDLSLAYPLKALSFIWVIILSKLYLHEELDKEKILASILILGGVVLLTLSA